MKGREDRRNSLVQNVAGQTTACQPCDGRQWESSRWCRERHTSNKDDGFNALSEDGNERQDKHGILLGEARQPAESSARLDDGSIERASQLAAPLVLHLADAKQRRTHDGDDDGSYYRKGTLIVQLACAPVVDTHRVKGANDTCRNNEANHQSEPCAEPYLTAELFVNFGFLLRNEGLLEPGEEDRHNDDSLDGLAKDDEEDGHGKDLRRHGGLWGLMTLCFRGVCSESEKAESEKILHRQDTAAERWLEEYHWEGGDVNRLLIRPKARSMPDKLCEE